MFSRINYNDVDSIFDAFHHNYLDKSISQATKQATKQATDL